MALTNEQKASIARKAYADVAAGKPSPFKKVDSIPNSSAQPEAPPSTPSTPVFGEPHSSREAPDALEVFPRPVMEDGKHTILQYGQYLVDAPTADRYAALTYMARDVRSAREMLEILAADPEGDLDNTTVHQALCIASIVMYAKGFKKRNNARKGLVAEKEIAGQLEPDLKSQHAYVMNLRDKFAAHDDGVGEDKERRMAFHLPPSKNTSELGVIVGTRRVVSIGADKANALLPLFKKVEELVSRERDRACEKFLSDAINNEYAGITLTGRYVETPLEI